MGDTQCGLLALTLALEGSTQKQVVATPYNSHIIDHSYKLLHIQTLTIEINTRPNETNNTTAINPGSTPKAARTSLSRRNSQPRRLGTIPTAAAPTTAVPTTAPTAASSVSVSTGETIPQHQESPKGTRTPLACYTRLSLPIRRQRYSLPKCCHDESAYACARRPQAKRCCRRWAFLLSWICGIGKAFWSFGLFFLDKTS